MKHKLRALIGPRRGLRNFQPLYSIRKNLISCYSIPLRAGRIAGWDSHWHMWLIYSTLGLHLANAHTSTIRTRFSSKSCQSSSFPDSHTRRANTFRIGSLSDLKWGDRKRISSHSAEAVQLAALSVTDALTKYSFAILPAAYRAWVSCYEIRERISLSQSRWCTYPVPVPVPARVFDTRRCQLQWLSPFIWIWIRKPGWTSTKALYWMCFPGWCTFILWKLQSHLLCIALLQTQRWAIPWDFQDYDQFHIPVNVGSAQELLRYVKDILSPRNSRI